MTEEKKDPINELIVESGLDAAEYAGVADVLATLRDGVAGDVPQPSPELAALLSGGTITALASRRRRRPVVVAGAVAAVFLVGTGVGAAANVLPEQAQRFFSEFSDDHLPFHIPSPDERGQSSQHTGDPDSDHEDQGLHVGNGEGDGKTDNPGKHLGQLKNDPGKPETNPGKKDENADNGNKGGNDQGKGKPDDADQPSQTQEKANNKDTVPGQPDKAKTPDKAKGKAPASGKPTAAPTQAATPVLPTPSPGPGNGNGNGNSSGNANENATTGGTGSGNGQGKGRGSSAG